MQNQRRSYTKEEWELLKKSMNKYNFSLAWGTGEVGAQLRKMVMDGMRRHNFKGMGEYIKHCIKQTSEQETKKESGS